ncbi:MAG TPA: nitronate monooxygenase, partial [Bdellovibrio sp.]|nr:nitronate monooxygenase [Bdellovibrio sp.]
THPCYRKALLAARTKNTTEITEAFSGRRARGLLNQFMKEFKSKGRVPLPFPLQNTLTQDIRKKAQELGIADYCSLWAGMNVQAIREMSARELIATLVNELGD